MALCLTIPVVPSEGTSEVDDDLGLIKLFLEEPPKAPSTTPTVTIPDQPGVTVIFHPCDPNNPYAPSFETTLPFGASATHKSIVAQAENPSSALAMFLLSCIKATDGPQEPPTKDQEPQPTQEEAESISKRLYGRTQKEFTKKEQRDRRINTCCYYSTGFGLCCNLCCGGFCGLIKLPSF